MTVQHATVSTPAMIALAVLAVAIDADAGEPSSENIATEVAAAFQALDTAPEDGILTGSEIKTIPNYDTDGDGRVTPQEFARCHVGKQPVAEWRRHVFAKEGFSCEMPGEPAPFDPDGLTHFQVAVPVSEPKALLIARTRDMPARAAGKTEAFFTTVVEQLEDSGARVLGRQQADLGLHRGSVVAAKREDGTLEVVRSVVIGRSVCELHAIVSPDAGQAGRDLAGRFMGSLQLAR